jgi:hypothetical protein
MALTAPPTAGQVGGGLEMAFHRPTLRISIFQQTPVFCEPPVTAAACGRFRFDDS